MEQIETSTFARQHHEDAWSRSTESDYDAIMNEINDELMKPNELSINLSNSHDYWGPDMIKPFLAAFQRVRGILVSAAIN